MERKCPTCGSPNRKWHPATQHEGEVLTLCRDAWHQPTAMELERALESGGRAAYNELLAR